MSTSSIRTERNNALAEWSTNCVHRTHSVLCKFAVDDDAEEEHAERPIVLVVSDMRLSRE